MCDCWTKQAWGRAEKEYWAIYRPHTERNVTVTVEARGGEVIAERHGTTTITNDGTATTYFGTWNRGCHHNDHDRDDVEKGG